MTISEQITKDLETALGGVTAKLKQDFGQIRGNRPSPDMIQDIRLSLYDQQLSIRELGSLNVLPPRTIQITVWDPGAVAAIMKAIDDAHLGLSTNNDGNTIRATLSPLGDERRDEMSKLVKKISEATRIQIRARREDAVKRLKDSENKKEITEDDAFKEKEKIQKVTDKANGEVESMVEGKLAELGE
ncbi:MAG TPA: ribosome-recycling factor [Candidatus Paceibacterota bacterium]|nr:ribosome-recycling factor [Candidatus Paceibacterota bacterium]